MIKNKKTVWGIVGLLICFNISVWSFIFVFDSSAGLLKVVFFDVGQGDSIFIELPDGFQILIDGGPDLSVLEKLGREMIFFDRTIDLIVLTHPDRDHLFGLLEVLKRYRIKNILWTGAVKDTAEWEEWNKLIEEEGAEIMIARAGRKIDLSDSAFFSIYHPAGSFDLNKNINNSSIVMKLVFNDVSFLFTGDILADVEKELTGKEPEIGSDILKVAHHGSKTSSSTEFLERVLPELAIISVGENSYGHPDPGVLANLQQFGIQVLTTKNNGDIKIISDGNNFKIKL